jgi:hypothetical protein
MPGDRLSSAFSSTQAGSELMTVSVPASQVFSEGSFAKVAAAKTNSQSINP